MIKCPIGYQAWSHNFLRHQDTLLHFPFSCCVRNCQRSSVVSQRVAVQAVEAPSRCFQHLRSWWDLSQGSSGTRIFRLACNPWTKVCKDGSPKGSNIIVSYAVNQVSRLLKSNMYVSSFIEGCFLVQLISDELHVQSLSLSSENSHPGR